MKNLRIIVINFLAAATVFQFSENHFHILPAKYFFTSLIPNTKQVYEKSG